MATAYAARAAFDDGGLADHLKTKLVRAVIRDGTIALDWPEMDGHTAQTLLTQAAAGKYTGHSVWAAGTREEVRAVVEATLYSNETGHMVVGEEKWANGKIDWFVVQLAEGRVST